MEPSIIAWTLGIFLFGPAVLVLVAMVVLIVVAGVTAVCDAVASAVRRLK